MTKYRLAVILRPLALLHIPVAAYLALIADLTVVAILWLLFGALVGMTVACDQCGYSVYYEKGSFLRSMLAKPHKVCSNCGNAIDVHSKG